MPSLLRSMTGDDLVLVSPSPTVQRRLVLTGPLGGPWNPKVTALIGSLERG